MLPAAQVVENAAAAGVELLALSDHDTVDGVDEALAAGAAHGVRVVPATEISAVDGPYEDLHVLGYGIDHRSARWASACSMPVATASGAPTRWPRSCASWASK